MYHKFLTVKTLNAVSVLVKKQTYLEWHIKPDRVGVGFEI